MTTTIDLNALNYTRDCYIESRTEADISVFEDYLPTIDFSNFYTLMYGIIAELKDKKVTNLNLLEQETDPEMQIYLREELGILNLKINICQEKLRKANSKNDQIQEIDFSSSLSQAKHIIFATEDYNNTYFEGDLRFLEKATYPNIVKCLEQIERGGLNFNPTQIRVLTGDNVKGIFESKSYQMRVFFRTLPCNCVYVLMVAQKKTNIDPSIIASVIKRKEDTSDEYGAIKSLLTSYNIDEMSNLINKNKKIIDGVIDKMKLPERRHAI